MSSSTGEALVEEASSSLTSVASSLIPGASTISSPSASTISSPSASTISSPSASTIPPRPQDAVYDAASAQFIEMFKKALDDNSVNKTVYDACNIQKNKGILNVIYSRFEDHIEKVLKTKEAESKIINGIMFQRFIIILKDPKSELNRAVKDLLNKKPVTLNSNGLKNNLFYQVKHNLLDYLTGEYNNNCSPGANIMKGGEGEVSEDPLFTDVKKQLTKIVSKMNNKIENRIPAEINKIFDNKGFQIKMIEYTDSIVKKIKESIDNSPFLNTDLFSIAYFYMIMKQIDEDKDIEKEKIIEDALKGLTNSGGTGTVPAKTAVLVAPATTTASRLAAPLKSALISELNSVLKPTTTQANAAPAAAAPAALNSALTSQLNSVLLKPAQQGTAAQIQQGTADVTPQAAAEQAAAANAAAALNSALKSELLKPAQQGTAAQIQQGTADVTPQAAAANAAAANAAAALKSALQADSAVQIQQRPIKPQRNSAANSASGPLIIQPAEVQPAEVQPAEVQPAAAKAAATPLKSALKKKSAYDADAPPTKPARTANAKLGGRRTRRLSRGKKRTQKKRHNKKKNTTCRKK